MLPIYAVTDINTRVCWDGQQFCQLIEFSECGNGNSSSSFSGNGNGNGNGYKW